MTYLQCLRAGRPGQHCPAELLCDQAGLEDHLLEAGRVLPLPRGQQPRGGHQVLSIYLYLHLSIYLFPGTLWTLAPTPLP